MSNCEHHHFELREQNGEEWLECTQCGNQGNLGLFQHHPQNFRPPLLPPGFGHTGHGPTTDDYLAAEKERQRLLRENATWPSKGGWTSKHQPIVKVRKMQHGNWLWTCRICDHFFMSTKWTMIIKSATHHARQQH